MSERTRRAGIACMVPVYALSLVLFPSLSVAIELPPIDWGGSLGYSYRSLSGPDTETTSHQFLGTINGATYLWRPWFAQVDGRLSMTLDNSDFANGATTEAEIATGELFVSGLPQSSTPFTLAYRVTDSRVDTSTPDPLIVPLGQDFSTQRLALTQSYIMSGGHRFRANYDFNEWDSPARSTVESEQVGLEMDFHGTTQRLVAEGRLLTTERLGTPEERKSTIVEVDHFYFPSRHLRVDTLANVVQTEDNFQIVSDVGGRESDQTQLSSFVFWRPQDRPLSLSGGIRFFQLDSNNVRFQTDAGGDILGGLAPNQTAEITNVSATAGAFYQLTKRLRLDARIDLAVLDSATAAPTIDDPAGTFTTDRSSTTTSARAGALYQSDVHQVSDYTYQWFASGFMRFQKDDADTRTQATGDPAPELTSAVTDRNSFGGTLSHDLRRYWQMSGNSTLRGTASQSLSPTVQSGDTNDATYHRLDHSVSAAWDHVRWGGTSMTQVILHDARNFGDLDGDSQMVNVQFNRNQPLSRLMSLSGSMTYQSVRQSFGALGWTESDTLTFNLTFQHQRLAGIPNLRYLSALSHSEASRDIGYDRFEWENRLDYNIGLVDARVSWRMFDYAGDTIDLIFMQVTRRF